MDALLQAPLFLFLRRAAMERLPTLTALFAGVIVFFWMVRSRSCICRPCLPPASTAPAHGVLPLTHRHLLAIRRECRGVRPTRPG